ncbi:hypothetical protein NMSP_1029 [Candidatus Nitrosomarinus catalina]|jgi:hypothetical protein|uniref:Uncharacterized protein n=1 Tax=Candidatus Nitrosomarinus catalinensis TaxID=1898749 RepID=A0A2Z2HMG4_9ARCH|nr:hypothetical protein [Candidatus Nitrosomarinus catalina]ARS64647.1 hypothetical protein NMSP_1029 [Candidatus Nitrosomarinus catalina]
MNPKSNEIKNKVKENSEKLMELGSILAKNQFSYKIEEKKSKEYWQNRIEDLQKYNESSIAYYNQVQNMMNLINKEKGDMFLLQISKFHQLGTELKKIMQEIEETPSIINSKDKQQSQWSKKVKEKLIEISTKCLEHEKVMNLNFRKFYDEEVKKILE